MNKKQQPTDDMTDEIASALVNRAVDAAIRQLQLKGVCRCIIAQGLVWRASFLHAEVVGVAETVGLLLEVADTIDAPDEGEMSETHH